MIKAINIDETKRYISKSERTLTNGSQPTVWILGMIDSQTLADIEDKSTVFESVPDESGRMTAKGKFSIGLGEFDYVRHGLRGFENFCSDPDGKLPVQIKRQRIPGGREVIHDDILRIIPRAVISELANEISSMNRMSPEEEKKIKSSSEPTTEKSPA